MRITRIERVIKVLMPPPAVIMLGGLLLLSTELPSQANQNKSNPKTNTSPTAPAKKTAPKKRSRGTTLVPPPPPTIPSVIDSGQVSMGSTGFIDYLSEEDLEWKKKTLEKELAARELDLQDSKTILERKLKQSETFEALFAEGVVSKRELENTRRQTDRLKRDVERENRSVEEVKRILSKIDQRLATVNKKATPKRSKKKKSR